MSPEDVPVFMNRLVEAYSKLPRVQSLVAVAAVHHRLMWVHPFADGNGRVGRLLSHALLREQGVGSELWAVSRGLARTVEAYSACLEAADEPRRGDLDGRGNMTAGGFSSSVAIS